MKAIKNTLMVTLAMIATVLVSCQHITPTIVPPMTEELGYSVPNLYGVTVTGLVDGSYKLEVQKLKLWRYSVEATLEATETVRNGLIDLAAIVGMGGVAALPMALKRVPSGAVKKEEHEAELSRVGQMAPEDFKKEVDAKG